MLGKEKEKMNVAQIFILWKDTHTIKNTQSHPNLALSLSLSLDRLIDR